MNHNSHNSNSNNSKAGNNEVFAGGATTSQHIDAEDDEHFNSTTFKLKRTRSIGLLDEFISPMEKAQREAEAQSQQEPQQKGQSDQEIDNRPNDDNKTNNATNDVTNNATNDNNEKRNETNENHDKELTKLVSPNFTSPEFMPHDDADIAIEPSLHVDYLSHQWDVSDISRSWRYVIQKRKDVAESARLENASWRTWAQRRSNLKTINPEELNWSKENDITWLYGPIVKDDESDSDDDNDHNNNQNEDDDNHHHSSKHGSNTASSAVAGDISVPSKSMKRKKGILKKRSVEDVMISHANLVKLEAMESRMKAKKEKRKEQLQNYYRNHKRTPSNEPPDFDDFDAISDKLNTQYRIPSNQNSAIDLSTLSNEKDKTSPSVISNNSTDDATNVSNLDLTQNANDSNNNLSDSKSISSSVKKNRHIHFNDEVQQCVAVDVINDEDDFDSDADSDAMEDDASLSKGSSSYMFDNSSSIGSTGDMDDADADVDADADEDDDEDDDDGGFFLKVRSPSGTTAAPPLVNKDKQRQEQETSKPDSTLIESSISPQKTGDSDSVSTSSSKIYRTIQLLPSTSLNYGSDEESSDEENPYTSSLSHNVNNSSSRGYDYYYDYNTVYTCDPTHGIYGNTNDDGTSPDVVDLPQDLAKYSNFETIPDEHKDNETAPIMDSQIINNNNYIYQNDSNNYGSGSSSESNSRSNSPKVQSPLFSARPDTSLNSAEGSGGTLNLNSNESTGPIGSGKFDLQGSDSDSDSNSEDEGLSISARSSSQSLAELVFNHTMTPIDNNNQEQQQQYQNHSFNPTPVNENISSINPRHSSTGLSKQDTSSNSLSSQFFGTTPLTKDNSSSALADQFFNAKEPTKISSPPVDKKSSTSPTSFTNAFEHDNEIGRTSPKSLPQTQSKASPLPPHTTSANAFLGNTTPPLEKQQKRTTSAFSLGNSDADSDSESENSDDDGQLLMGGIESPSVNPPNIESYKSLSQVAGRNGISSSPQSLPKTNDLQLTDPISPKCDSEGTHLDKTIVNHAKGLATNLLGNWKSHEHS